MRIFYFSETCDRDSPLESNFPFGGKFIFMNPAFLKPAIFKIGEDFKSFLAALPTNNAFCLEIIANLWTLRTPEDYATKIRGQVNTSCACRLSVGHSGNC